MDKILSFSMRGLNFNVCGVVLLLWLVTTGITSASASASASANTNTNVSDTLSFSEQRYRIALLLSLAKFSRWPDSAFSSTTEPFMLCLLGSDATIRALAQVEGARVRGRKIKLRYFKRVARLSEQNKCHIFYISGLNPLPTLLRLFSDFPVLTMSNRPKFAEEGGVVEFIQGVEENQFIVNLSAVERAHLKISAQLLGMAKIIRK